MTLLTELDLAKSEPVFLWRRPLFYTIEGSGSSRMLVFGRLSRAARFSLVGLFAVLASVGVTGIILGWPLFAAIGPIVVTTVGAWAESIGRRKFTGCQLEVNPEGVTIITPADRLRLPRLVEIRVENRWKRRDGSFTVDGDSQLFLAVEETPGRKLFFPLANSGVLGDLDALAADIASAAGCRVNKELVK
jgi:hypothetical protein